MIVLSNDDISSKLAESSKFKFQDQIIYKSLSKNEPGQFFDDDFKFCHQKFDENVDVKIDHYVPHEELVFDIKGLDASFVNALRRIMISDVPSVAPEKIHMFQNTSIIQDDVLAHRIGLIPIDCDPDFLEFPSDPNDDNGSPLSEKDSIQFELNVKCYKDSNGEIFNSKVLSSQLKWIPIGNQKLTFDRTIKPVFEDIIIAKLVPGQEIAMKIFCIKGTGFDHAKFSPVSTAYYRLMPYVQIKEPVLGEDAHLLSSLFGKGVIGIKTNSEGQDIAFVENERLDNGSRNYMMYEGLKDKVVSGRISDHYIFCIESVGNLDPIWILHKSLEILSSKCSKWIKQISS